MGAALAMEAQENEPKSRRVFAARDVTREPHACSAGIGEEHGVVGCKFAERGGEIFGADGFDAGAFDGLVLQKLVEGLCAIEVLREKLAVGFWLDAGEAVLRVCL